MRTASDPNIVDTIVVMVTCLVVLMLAFPLSAAERSVADRFDAEGAVATRTVPEIQIFKVEFSVVERPEQQMKQLAGEKSDMNKQLTGPGAEDQAGVENSQANVDLDSLKQRLKNSKAIGLFTKLEIRNDIVGLVDDIDRYRKQELLETKLAEVRSSFDGLLSKMVELLKEDPILSRDLYTGREHIWKSLIGVKV